MLRKLSPMLASAFATLLLAGVAVAAVGSNSSAGADASIATEASTTAATEGSTSTSDGSTATTDGSTSTTTGDDDGTTSTTIEDDDTDGTTATTVGDDDNDGTTVSTVHEGDDDDDEDGPTPTTMRDDTDDDHQLVIEPGVYTFPLANGGSVTVTIEQQLIVDFVIDAGDGWSYTIEQHEDDRLRVELTNGETEIEIEIRTDGGLEVEIDD